MDKNTVINGYNYIPKENRKKILLLSDDARLFSGVGVVSKQIIESTAHVFNWVQLGAAVTHPENGKKIDFSKQISDSTGVIDASVIIYPNSGYGDQIKLRSLIDVEKPDAILHFTDPRFWGWLYDMEREVRRNIPILYYHVWDNEPLPYYNKPYYQSCDLIMNISKQTYNIVKYVLGEDNCKDINTSKFDKNQTLISYIPHGINPNQFYPINKDNPGNNIAIDNDFKSEYELVKDFKKQMGINDDDFVILYNNRNVRRKMTSDVIVAYERFCNLISEKEAKKCVLILHTTPIDNNGTNLFDVASKLCTHKIIFSDKKLEVSKLNYLYNIADITINIASAEGFGLSTAESLMASTPILVNITGGLQDQVGFLKEDGTLLNVFDFNENFLTNHFGNYKQHGEWANIVFPAACSIVGSPPTPYIYDDRVNIHDVTQQLYKVFVTGKVKNKERGLKGREFLLSDLSKMNVSAMGKSFIHDINIILDKFKPREAYSLHKI